MRILVLGGTRFVGRQLVTDLLGRGEDLTLLTRGLNPDPFGDRVQRILCDRWNRERFRKTLSASGDWDAVVDFCGFSPDLTRDAVEVLGGRTGHFLHVSSDAVYLGIRKEEGSSWVEEDTELDSWEPEASRHPDWEYAERKRGSERVLRESGDLPSTLSRFPIIQGPWDYTLRSWRYQIRLRSRRPIALPHGGRTRSSFLFSRDAAKALLACLDAGDRALGEALHFAGPEQPSLRSYLEAMAEALGIEPSFEEAPLEDGTLGSREWHPYASPDGRDWLLDCGKSRALLGWEPTPMASWLPETCAWFEGPENPFDPHGLEPPGPG